MALLPITLQLLPVVLLAFDLQPATMATPRYPGPHTNIVQTQVDFQRRVQIDS